MLGHVIIKEEGLFYSSRVSFIFSKKKGKENNLVISFGPQVEMT